ncbi:hypothetical protein GCM10027168_09190 [Streptomyces capparidis]|jgi:hypothetical protein
MAPERTPEGSGGDHGRPADPPPMGSLVRETGTDRIAEVMAVGYRGRLYLRPVGGGREWEAEPHAVRVLSPNEALAAKQRRVDARGRGGERGCW